MKLNFRSFLLIVILTTIVLVIDAVTLSMLYQTTIKQQLEQLTITAKSNALLIEADFIEHITEQGGSTIALEEIHSLLRNSEIHRKGFGKTGEFILGQVIDNSIHFIFKTRHHSNIKGITQTKEGLIKIPLNDQYSLPIQEALKGNSGTTISYDYRKIMVLAAYEPLPRLGYGFVAKIDLSEVQAPFITAAIVSLVIALFLIMIGSLIYIRINNAALEELQEREHYNRLLFESSPIGLALCRMDGTLVDINSAYAKIIGRTIEEVKSLSYWDITPKSYEAQEAKQLEELQQNDHYGPYEKEYIHKDGYLVPVSLIGHKIKINDEYFIWSSVEDITERNQIKNDLYNAIKFNKRTLCNAPIGMAIYDQTGQCIEANQTLANIVGGTKAQLLAQNYHNIQSWKESGLYTLALDTVHYGINSHLEKQVTSSFGKTAYIEALMVSYEVGGQTYLLLMLNDISQRKEVEQALKRSEETLARAQTIANIGNWDWDMLSGNIDWTDEIFRIFGLSPQGFKPSYEAFLERIHPDDIEKVTSAVNTSVQNKQPYNIEHRIVRPTGEIRFVHEQGVVYCEDDQPVRMIGTVHDITELKAADRAHRIQMERNDMLLKTVQDGYWIVSPSDGTLLDANDAYCEMSGYSKEELLGMPISDLDADHDDAKVQENIQKLVTDGFIQFETRHRRKDGFIYNVEISTSLANLGDETFLVVFIKNITERKQNEQQLAQYRENLEQLVTERTKALSDTQEELVRKERLATLGQLTATVSHELRNPLSAMGPSLFILEKLCPGDNEKVNKAIAILQRSVWRCDHIVDELLDFTRISTISEEDLILDDWLDELIAEQHPAKEISIIKNFTVGKQTCHFDPNVLRRAVVNVFENACQAMTDEKSKQTYDHAQLTISTRAVNGRAEITFRDTGKGMSEELLAKIFEPLYSTKVYGVGLGMPTIKQIMEQHKGGIEIESKENQGTSVMLWLPLHQS